MGCLFRKAVEGKSTTAKFTCILRDKNGTIAGWGTSEGVSIKQLINMVQRVV